MSADREPTASEVLEWRRDDVISPRDRRENRGFRPCGTSRPDSSSAVWPARSNGAPPAFVTLSMRPASDREFVALAQWNMLWEAAQFRRRFFDLDDLPEQMAKIADISDVNVTFVPRTRARYFEYAPLFTCCPSAFWTCLDCRCCMAVSAMRPFAKIASNSRHNSTFGHIDPVPRGARTRSAGYECDTVRS